MNKIAPYLEGVRTVGIAGHVKPDGDCVGSVMGLYLYLAENYPKLNVDVYLEYVQPEFYYLKKIDEVKNSYDGEKKYDLFILLDTSTEERIGVASEAFKKADRTIGIDHHVSNPGFADENHIVPDASSASETLYELLDEEKITLPVAEAIYTGIIHDSGVFQQSNTRPRTLEIAGKLMAKGVPFAKIIDESFNQKTYEQQQILGRTLMESIRLIDGKCIVGIVTQKEMDFYGISKQDLDGIVGQMRRTKGVEVAIFLYQTGAQEFKVSLRSNSYLDVNEVASKICGGGHVRAAGCTMTGSVYDAINNLTYYIEKMLKDSDD